jgi:hypothetical protein
MAATWQLEGGRLVARWSETGPSVRYGPKWMQDVTNVQSGYLPPVPDFASHSPFGGASWFWFIPHTPQTDSE